MLPYAVRRVNALTSITSSSRSKCALRGSLLAADEVTGGAPHRSRKSASASRRDRPRSSSRSVLHHHGAADLDEPFCRILEVPDVRPEDARHPVPRRLDHALPAALAVETAAGEADVRQPPRGPRLAHGVEQ